MKIELVQTTWDKVECDAMILPVFQDDDYASGVLSEIDARLDGLLKEVRDNEEWKGKTGDCTVIYRPAGLSMRRLILVGGGEQDKYDLDTIRQVAMVAANTVKSYNLKRVAFYRRSRVDAPVAAQAAVEGVLLATYSGDDFKTSERSKNFLEEILFVTPQAEQREQIEEMLQRGRILAECTNYARYLVNQPGNRINPPKLAEEARTTAEKYGLSIEVLGEPEMEKEGMQAALAVARGSDEPARFIILKHHGGGDGDAPIVLVGKGVTFDSGGYSLKPPSAMEDMKVDKSGACAVLAAMQAVARLGVKKNVIGLIPTVENMVSGRAQRPGDIVRSLSGKTIEVLNTDAEGRLILADALTYAHRYKPAAIVDIATLTGACVVALAHIRAGVFANHEGVYGNLREAARRSSELLWRLPLDKGYRKLLESDIADIKNVGGRWGGAVTAAKFLEEFVGDLPWAHIDMAGVDSYDKSAPLKGATGFGTRILVEFVSLYPVDSTAAG
ncbi:MAG TPA: leucyl aminopeptidase [Acidobacteriota bacterium]|nr:leucyl aminopeptidase [Acidobacteriota bacterium]